MTPIRLGSSQNYAPIWVPLKFRCRNITFNPKGPIILRRTHLTTQLLGCKGSGNAQAALKLQRLKAQGPRRLQSEGSHAGAVDAVTNSVRIDLQLLQLVAKILVTIHICESRLLVSQALRS